MTRKTEIFEKMPVGKAVAVLAIPTILGQLVTMIYNLADTYFIGRTGNPQMVAAASLAFPAFLLLTALSNLFGIGGGSLISRLLGAKSFDDTKKASAFSFYGCLAVTAIYSAVVFVFMTSLLNLLGASDDTREFARQYLFWTTVVGGIPTTISVLIGNLLRSEGRVAFASIGMAMGGIINIILDPIFIFPLDMGIEGAAIATMISNCCSMVYFIIVYIVIRKKSVISLSPKNFTLKKSIAGSIVGVGIPSFVSLMLVCVSNGFLMNLASQYSDIAVASIGVVKKIDTIPLNIGLGLSQGILPIVAYNYSARNYRRMDRINLVARTTAITFSVLCIVVFQLFPNEIVGFFMKDSAETVELATRMLRILCLATPFMLTNLLMNTSFQAMGKGPESLLLSSCRQGVFFIPCLFVMRHLAGLDGIVWTQFISDGITLVISFALYYGMLKKMKKINQVAE
ncbi:MAG: MATE family efflux transporter [Clostridia bacterium]|nr:MATE family efflux transporter [Clostridia bacterium]